MPELPPLPPGFALDNSGPVYGAPPKPPAQRDPLQMEKDRIDIQKGQADIANLPLEAEKTRLDMEKTRADLAKAQQATGGDVKRAQTIQALTGEVRRLYQRDIQGQPASRGFGALEYIDSIPSNERFTAAANTILPMIRPLVAQSAKEGDSDREMLVFQSYIPSADDSDITIEQKMKMLEMMIGGMVDGIPPSQSLGAMGGGQAQVAPDPSGVMDQSRNLAEIEAPSAQQMAPSTNGFQTVDNPALTGVRGEYLRRLEANQGPGEIIQFLRSAGVTDPKVLQSAAQQANYRKQYPNVPIANYNTEALDDMDVPLSTTESMMNDAAQSSLGAYGMHAGQAASFNTLDEMAPNQERAQIALADASRNSPVASGLGMLSGGVMSALGGEAGLARLGVGAGVPRALAADVGYGAASGAGAAEAGGRGQGALLGGVAGGAGSLGGQALARGAASAISPTGGRLADLYEAGVRPSLGQRVANANDGQGLRGLAGRAVNATEEALQSVPIVGSAISGTRQRARDQFQIGAFNQALAEIGEQLPRNMRAGTDPHRYAQQAFNRVYDEARRGMRVVADEELTNQLGELAQQVDLLSEPSANRFRAMVENILTRRVENGELSGQAFQRAHSDIGRQIRTIRNNPSGDGELAQMLQQLQETLDTAARRHSDPAAVELLDGANAGYSRLVRIEDAARRRGGDDGTFTPTQFNAAVQNMSGGRGARGRQHLRGDALMQDYAQQGMSLADRMPNSGTTDRALVAGTAGTAMAGYMEPSILGFLGALGAAYAPGVRNVTTGAMAPRGPRAQAIAGRLRRRARLLGASGATMAVQGTSPDQ